MTNLYHDIERAEIQDSYLDSIISNLISTDNQTLINYVSDGCPGLSTYNALLTVLDKMIVRKMTMPDLVTPWLLTSPFLLETDLEYNVNVLYKVGELMYFNDYDIQLFIDMFRTSVDKIPESFIDGDVCAIAVMSGYMHYLTYDNTTTQGIEKTRNMLKHIPAWLSGYKLLSLIDEKLSGIVEKDVRLLNEWPHRPFIEEPSLSWYMGGNSTPYC